MINMDNVLIIDFMNYVHRCRVGNLDGEYVLVFNFFRNLRSTVEQFNPVKLFFALEGHPKHRYELYSEYKANRIIKIASKQEAKDHVIRSAEIIQKLLLSLPVTLVQHPDFEADDIINTLCFNMKDEQIVICSSDTDCIQILQNNYSNCRLFNPIKKIFIEPPEENYVALKSLLGDKSDNIPSILTPKKAEKTISNPELFKKFMELEENRANFNINRQLIEFHKVPEEQLVLQEGSSNFESLKEEFTRMDFQSLINDISWNKFVNTFNCLKF